MVTHPMKMVHWISIVVIHIHNIETKRCKVNNDSATYLWHCRLGHIGVKAHEETSCSWAFGIT